MEKKSSAKKPRSERAQLKRSGTGEDSLDLARMRKALGAHIRLLRERHGVSQIELADAAEIHRIYLGEIERGDSNVTLGVLVRIARSLKITVADLFRDLSP
jgi:DNA-binding XRE family transcriptional regulator